MSALPALALRLDGGLSARESISLAQAAEAASFEAAWFTENLFKRSMGPATAGAIAATTRLRIGLGVINPYNRHPVQIAMEAAALDEMSNGRLVLAIGAGNGERLKRMGVGYGKPVSAVRESIAIVRGLLAGESVTFAGAVFSIAQVKLDFKPLRTHVPIYMAAMGDQAVRACGQSADGLVVSNMCAPGYAARAMGLLEEGATAQLRPVPRSVIHNVFCLVDRDGNEARLRAARAIAERLVAYWALGERVPAVRQALIAESGVPIDEYGQVIERLARKEDPVQVIDRRFIDAYSIAGTAAECLEGARRFAAGGATELVLGFCDGDTVAQMRELGAARERSL